MQEQLVFENGNLSFKNETLTEYSVKMLNTISESLRGDEESIQKKPGVKF